MNNMKQYGRFSFVRVWSAPRRYWYVIVRAWHGLAKNMAWLFRNDMFQFGNGINIFGMYLFLLCLTSYPRHAPQAPRRPCCVSFQFWCCRVLKVYSCPMTALFYHHRVRRTRRRLMTRSIDENKSDEECPVNVFATTTFSRSRAVVCSHAPFWGR